MGKLYTCFSDWMMLFFVLLIQNKNDVTSWNSKWNRDTLVSVDIKLKNLYKNISHYKNVPTVKENDIKCTAFCCVTVLQHYNGVPLTKKDLSVTWILVSTNFSNEDVKDESIRENIFIQHAKILFKIFLNNSSLKSYVLWNIDSIYFQKH